QRRAVGAVPVRLPPTAGPAAFAQRAKLPPPVQPVLPPSGPRTSCAPTPPPASPSVFWQSIELLAASAHLPRRNSHEHPPAAFPVPLPTSLPPSPRLDCAGPFHAHFPPNLCLAVEVLV